jgi:hypothetical protein
LEVFPNEGGHRDCSKEDQVHYQIDKGRPEVLNECHRLKAVLIKKQVQWLVSIFFSIGFGWEEKGVEPQLGLQDVQVDEIQ